MSRAPRKPPLPPPEPESTARPFPAAAARTRALVLCPAKPHEAHDGRTERGRLDEAVGLARAIDLDVVAAETVALRNPRPATLFGCGGVRAAGEVVVRERIDLVVVDAPLTAVQQRNLERAWSCKVIDRTGLILEIFGERARTSEGSLQVELAALTYQRSRLVRSWTHLERQRGGFGFLGGPGESQIELDRRRIDDRITRIWCCTCATWPIPRARHSATTCSRCCAAWSWASWPTKGGCWSSGTSSTCCRSRTARSWAAPPIASRMRCAARP